MELIKREKLTGLLYFDFFKEEAQAIIDRNDNRLVLFSVNIDDFTYINHKYGYLEGDTVLIKMAKHFVIDNKKVLVASRAYSDHFFILSQICDGVDETTISKEIDHYEFVRRMKQEYPLVAFDVSIGIYIIDKPEPISSAIDKVELARRSVDGNYKIPVAVYRDELMQKEITSQSIIPMFRHAMESNRVIAYYQPKINSYNKKIVGAEALARIIDEDGTILSPFQFVGQLEKTSLVSELDLFILEQVYKDMTEWKKQGKTLTPISINLSRVDLYDDCFTDRMKDIISKYSIDRKYLIFEVTETMFFDDLEYMIDRVNQIKDMGYKVSLDDFGSGYSSLSMVSKLPVDEIKFDRSFVQNSIDNDKGIRLMKGLVDTIKGVDLDIIGEGIETVNEEKIMQSCGCNVIQGYVYDKPLKKDEFVLKYL